MGSLIAGLLMLAAIGGIVLYGKSYNAEIGDRTACPRCGNLGSVLTQTGKIRGRKVVRFRCKKCHSYFDR